MSRHEIRGLVAGVVLVIGWDRTLGFYVEIRGPGQHIVYDATTTDDGTTSIAGALKALIAAEVIARSDVADAERWLSAGDVENIPCGLVGVRVAAEVIVHLREAAGA